MPLNMLQVSVVYFALLLLCAHAWRSTMHITTSLHLQTRNTKTMNTRVHMSSNEEEACGTCSNAPKCSGAYRNKGCDGTGKIQGGIATIPLFSWWPIKVYRPCPSYLQAGYSYQREGQTMDQVLFSEPSTKMKQKMEAMAVYLFAVKRILITS